MYREFLLIIILFMINRVTALSANRIDEHIVAMMDSARFYESSGKEEISMKWYSEAEQLAEKSLSDSLKGHLFYSIAQIYDKVLMAHEYAEVYYNKAAESFIAGKDTAMSVISRLKIADLLLNDRRYDQTAAILKALDSIRLKDSAAWKRQVVAARYAVQTGRDTEAQRLIEQYLADCPPQATDWLSVAEIQMQLHDTIAGKASVDSASRYIAALDSIPLYYKLLSDVQSFEDNDKEALDSYKKYVAITSSIEMKARHSSARYIKEQHQRNLIIESYRGAMMIALASVVLLIAAAIFIMFVLRRSKMEQVFLDRLDKDTKSRIRNIQDEMSLLKNILKSNLQNSPELRELVSERLHILETCMASVLSTKEDKVIRIAEIMNKVKEDRVRFQESLRLTFTLIKPQFIDYLEDKGLTREQIHICCLYAIGMTGKEIMSYTEKKRTYNVSSEIRTRLGLSTHDTNLGKFLKDLMGTFSIILLLLCTGCTGNPKVSRQLDHASAIMNIHPDSALDILKSVSTDDLTTRKQKARYALLLSMALDKDSIDVTSDSLIRIALDYYKYHGTADDKLKTYYYLGNAYLCMYDYEAAINSFLTAEQYAGKVEDKYALALLYNTSAYIYVKIKDPKAIEYYRKSADVFYQAGDTNRAVRSLLYRLIVCDACDSDSIGEATYREIEQVRPKVDKEYLHQYYGIRMSRAMSEGDTLSVRAILDEYRKLYDINDMDLANLAEAQMFLGQFEDAERSLKMFRQKFTARRLDIEYTFYYLRLASVYDAMKQYSKALQEYRHYVALNDSITKNDLASDTKYLRDRNQHELALRKFRNRVVFMVILGIAFVVLVGGLTYEYMVRKKNNRKLRLKIEKDKERLSQMQNELRKLQEESSKNNDERMSFICKQLETLNSFLAKSFVFEKGGIGKGVLEEMEKLAKDRDSFLESLYETFTLTHPDFLDILEKHGLTKEEKFICCLYAIGLQGKDIMAYLGRKRHYLDSSEIRNKLGLTEHDVNLGKYIRSIC